MNVEEQISGIMGLPGTYIGEAPIDVDECQWIKAVSGRASIHFQKGLYNYESYMLYFRGKNNRAVHKRAWDIYNKLQAYEGKNFVMILRGFPRYVGRDDNYRVVYSFEIEYQIGG